MSECVSAIFVVSILIVVGMLLISSVDVASQLVLFGGIYRNIFTEHVERLVVGVIFMIITAMIDYKVHEKLAFFYYLLSIGLLIMPLFHPAVGGSHRWVSLGSFNFQPSEFAKIAVIIFLSNYISQNKSRIREFYRGFLLPVLSVLPILGLILIEPDLSTTAILFVLILLLLYSHGVKGLYVLATICFLVILVLGLARMNILLHDYQLERLRSFFQGQIPEQVSRALQAIREGRMLGEGLGTGTVKLTVPAVATDFILAVLGEELGLVGIIGVMTLFIILVGVLLKSLEKITDTFATCYVTGFSFLILIQFLVNLGVVSGGMPVTGVTLPFVSYGGSSLVTMLAAFGIVVNILTRQPAGSETK